MCDISDQYFDIQMHEQITEQIHNFNFTATVLFIYQCKLYYKLYQ